MATARAQPSPRSPKPSPVRICAFVDGLNLFNWAKRCFRYNHPNYDIARLVQAVVDVEQDRQLVESYFYVGIPRSLDDAQKYEWWTRKLGAIGRSRVRVVRRYLKRRELKIHLEGVVYFDTRVPRLQEKGIDLKLGLDLVRLARNRAYDAAIIFSQDGDLVEAVEEVHEIAREQNRWIQVECAYPVAPGVNSWPIRRTIPRQITKAIYDTCIDRTDYRVAATQI